jgi:hypothetical protein
MPPLPASVWIVTGALIAQSILAVADGATQAVVLLALAGPILTLWMVWAVLTDRRAPPRDLAAGEEWGYSDRPDLRPR